jgi:hypothetical protein
MTKVGIIIEMLISMSLKDIKCAFSFLNKIFIVLDSHIFVKLSNDTTPFSILPGFFNSTGNIDKAYFDNFLLSVHRIENPNIIEIYSIG